MLYEIKKGGFMDIYKLKKAKRKNKNPESEVCVALWDWFQLQYKNYKDRYLRFEVKQSSKINQVILKREGNKAGTSDIFLAVPQAGFCGLWLEVKADKGRLSDNQKSFQAEMEGDYFCATGYGVDQCMDIINKYLSLNKRCSNDYCNKSDKN